MTLTPLILLEQGLLQLLKADPDVSGFATVAGIFLNSVPETAPDPSCCFSKISATPDTTNDGPSGLNFRRYQFETFSKDYPTALLLAAYIRKAIDGFSGTLPNGKRVFNIIRDNEIDGFDDVTGESRVITDYFIHYLDANTLG